MRRVRFPFSAENKYADLRPNQKYSKRSRRTHRAVSLVELLVSTLIFTFVLTAAVSLYSAGNVQQNRARYYSQAQTDLRLILRTASRTIRHAYGVVSSSTESRFPSGSKSSSQDQIIVRVPEPARAKKNSIEIRFYVLDGAFYAQRSDEAAPGTKFAEGVKSLKVNYFRSTGSFRNSADNAPATATEAQLNIQNTVGNVSSGAAAYIAFRNADIGL